MGDPNHKDQFNWLLFARVSKLVCDAIAVSADEPDCVPNVEKWPAGLQLAAFEVVARLTIPTLDPLLVVEKLGVALAPLNRRSAAETQH